jgi:hypothetical protein
MLRRRTRGQRGQVMVETAIVLSILVFVILGALQVALIGHGRIMTEYAAYNAARAGIVHNANWNVMRNAAMISTLPLYRRTDTALELLRTWAEIKAAAEITEAIDTGVGTLERLGGDLLGVEIGGVAQDVSLIEVRVTSPNRDAFRDAQAWMRQQETKATGIDSQAPLEYPEGYNEIDFDDVMLLKDHPEVGRLAVEVRVLYPLKIPLANKLLFELWLAQLLLNTREIRSDITEWAQLRGRITRGGGSGQYVDEAVEAADGEGPVDDFFTTRQWVKETRTLRWVAQRHGIYLIPLYATYAMQMQSNMFEKNRREPVWFTAEDF